ncbi:MAG TPA: Coq4 family protein [Kofleriaceae bacterium]|nr:Coq4 family protein [Kofleriaceae bacterium]
MPYGETARVALPRSLVGRLVAGLRAFRRLVANPADPLHGPIFQMCVEHALLRKVTRRLERHGEGRRLLAERPRLNATTVALATMAEHPPRSLGSAYAAYFAANGITPFDPPRLPVETNQDYVATRLREAHDVLHVVTGYGTDELGELELQWFNFGNVGWGPLPIIVLVAFFAMGHAKKHGGWWRVWRHVRAAYRRGRQSRALASVIWEDYWQLPVRDVQALLCAPVEG